MKSLDPHTTVDALRATGEVLASKFVAGPLRLLVVGGAAGLLEGSLRASRTTADCDVMRITPEDQWERVLEAARAVARLMDLPATWLNRECAMFAWCMPLGWEGRCEPVGRFGPLEVVRAARVDLIAAKVVSAPRRPQDLEDLRDLRPSGDELRFVLDHLDRLEGESLDRESFDDRRTIVTSLRSGKRGAS